LKPEVMKAIAEIAAAYGGNYRATELTGGNAKIVVSGLSLSGGPFEQSDTWCGFTVTFAHPYADIYPHFVRPDLSRRDKKSFGQGFHPNQNFYGQNAMMLSRRCKLAGAEYPTSPVLKLEKVMQWLISQ
jgi:hypothetical protein